MFAFFYGHILFFIFKKVVPYDLRVQDEAKLVPLIYAKLLYISGLEASEHKYQMLVLSLLFVSYGLKILGALDILNWSRM